VTDHWFEPIADQLGRAYLRYSFTKGTDQEVGFLIDALGLHVGSRVLDVGCGPGRHARALAARGIEVHGVDISHRFVDLARDGAPAGATFERGDARALDFDAEFDVAISLCQGAFGLGHGPRDASEPAIDPDEAVLSGMRAAVVPGGHVALSAFSAYFQVHHLRPEDDFDPARGVNHEDTVIRDEQGEQHPAQLWTSVYTPRELRQLAASVGLRVEAIWGVEPGDYARRAPDLDHAELLLVARRPA
jgi:SAM-dependent methyltransferase